MARTLVDVQEEYTLARNAWKKAVEISGYGTGGVTVSRQDIEKLRKEVDRLAAEMARFSAGGIIPKGVTPCD